MATTDHVDLLEGLPIGVSERTRGRTISEGEFAAVDHRHMDDGRVAH